MISPAAVLQRLKSPKCIYHKSLEPHIWYANGEINKLASNALQMIAWSYIAYLQRIGFPFKDEYVRDIFIHGSTTNYYYDDTSDIDICIIADLDELYKMFPGIDLYVLLKSMLGSWLRGYRISVFGRGIDIEFVDVNKPYYATGVYKVGSAYSLTRDMWIRRPQLLKPHEIRTIRRNARRIYREIRKQWRKIRNNKMGSDFVETFLMRLSHERKESYMNNFMQPVTAETMAFRMARRRGILRDLRERAARDRSRNFNLTA